MQISKSPIISGYELSLSRHFEYANKQITYHFWLCEVFMNVLSKYQLISGIVLNRYINMSSVIISYRYNHWSTPVN